MGVIQLLILLVIVGICGAIAEWIVGYIPGSLVMTVIVGVIGAYFGGWLNSLLPFEIPIIKLFTLEIGDYRFNLIWSVLGSILLLLLLNMLRSRQRSRVIRRR